MSENTFTSVVVQTPYDSGHNLMSRATPAWTVETHLLWGSDFGHISPSIVPVGLGQRKTLKREQIHIDSCCPFFKCEMPSDVQVCKSGAAVNCANWDTGHSIQHVLREHMQLKRLSEKMSETAVQRGNGTYQNECQESEYRR